MFSFTFSCLFFPPIQANSNELMPLPRHYLLCFFCLFILWLCLTYIFMSPFQSEIKGMGKKAGASIEMSQESGNLTQCKQVMASRDAVCNTSARRCEVRALHTIHAAAACHRHYSTSCVVLCSAAPALNAALCVCACVPLRPSRKKSPHFLLFHKQDGLSPLHPHHSH